MNRKQYFMTVATFLVFTGAGVVFAAATKRVPFGKWGGQHVNLTVTQTGFELEFDCGTGSAKGAPAIDRIGRFKLHGTYVTQPGSPSVPRESRPAEYSGSVKGQSMTLEVRLTDTKQLMGSYKLSFGQHQRLNKCPVRKPPEINPPPE